MSFVMFLRILELMAKKGNRKNHAMSTLFDIMRLIRRGKSSIKKFPNDVIITCLLKNW